MTRVVLPQRCSKQDDSNNLIAANKVLVVDDRNYLLELQLAQP